MRPTPEEADDIRVLPRISATEEDVRERIEIEERNHGFISVTDSLTGREELGRRSDDYGPIAMVARGVANDTCLGGDCNEIVDGNWCTDCDPMSCYGEDCSHYLPEDDEGWFCNVCRLGLGGPQGTYPQQANHEAERWKDEYGEAA